MAPIASTVMASMASMATTVAQGIDVEVTLCLTNARTGVVCVTDSRLQVVFVAWSWCTVYGDSFPVAVLWCFLT